MRQFIFTSITIVVFVAMLSILGDSIAIKFEDISHTETQTYTAVNGAAASEYLELTYNYDVINYITVNAVALDLEADILTAFSDADTIVLVVAASTTGDAIEIEYTYLVETPIDVFSNNVQTLIDLIPLIVVSSLIISIAVIKFKSNKV